MANGTRARSANGDERRAPGADGAQQEEQADFFRGILEEMRRDREERRRQELPRQLAPPPPEVFKSPEYNGTGSVEVFIRQFLDVAEANTWGERAALLHLRRALKDDARDCGGASDTLAEVFTALRARYGISSREARIRLNSARKESGTPLQNHAARLKELVGIAYPEMPREVQEQMALDQFVNTVNHPRLQEHLLAIRPDSIAEAVTAGNEFLQVRGSQRVKKVELEPEIETETEEGEQVKPVKAPPPMNPDGPPRTYGPSVPWQPALGRPASAQTAPPQVPPGAQMAQPGLPMGYGPVVSRQPAPVQPALAPAAPFPGQPGLAPVQQGQIGPGAPSHFLLGGSVPDPMATLMAAMAQMAQNFSTLQQSLGARRAGKMSDGREVTCWHCGKVGHFKTRCPVLQQQPGNKGGQQ